MASRRSPGYRAAMNEWRFPAWDPVILELWDPIHLRWYGAMFLLAFIAGQAVLKRLARGGLLGIPEAKVGDFVFWLIFGVLLGGRFGYSIFYQPELWSKPLELFKVWQGGLSFHGGLIGVAVTLIVFARRHGANAWRLADGCAIAVPPGIACVRLANFINGELFGREVGADGPPWAMRFPTEDRALQLLGITQMGKREQELAIRKAVHGEWSGMPEQLRTVPSWDSVKDQVPLRHPSQLYELIGEGILMSIALYVIVRATRRRPLGSGVYGGIFLIGYGCARFVIEWYRQPDRQFEQDGQIGTVLWDLSMGQLLCLAMILAGVAMATFRRRYRPAASGV